MAGLLGYMFAGGAEKIGSSIGDRIRKDAALAREQALQSSRFQNEKTLQEERIKASNDRSDKEIQARVDLEGQRTANEIGLMNLRDQKEQQRAQQGQETWKQGRDDMGAYQENSSGKREYYGSGSGGKMTSEDQKTKFMLEQQAGYWSKALENSTDPTMRDEALKNLRIVNDRLEKFGGVKSPQMTPDQMLNLFMSDPKNKEYSRDQAIQALSDEFKGLDFSGLSQGAPQQTKARPNPNELPTLENGDFFALEGRKYSDSDSKELKGLMDKKQSDLERLKGFKGGQNQELFDAKIKDLETAIGAIKQKLPQVSKQEAISELDTLIVQQERLKAQWVRSGNQAKAQEAEANIQALKAKLSQIQGS